MRIIRIAKLNEQEEFQQWFQGSKVVDKNGDPLEVYHGTNRDFEKFQLGVYGNYGPGIYLTADPYLANNYARGEQGKIHSLYAKMLNPYFVKKKDSLKEMIEVRNGESPRDFLAKQGHDGIIDNYMFQQYGTLFVAFLPSQLRKAPNQKGLDQFDYKDTSYPIKKRKDELIPYDQFGSDEIEDYSW